MVITHNYLSVSYLLGSSASLFHLWSLLSPPCLLFPPPCFCLCPRCCDWLRLVSFFLKSFRIIFQCCLHVMVKPELHLQFSPGVCAAVGCFDISSCVFLHSSSHLSPLPLCIPSFFSLSLALPLSLFLCHGTFFLHCTSHSRIQAHNMDTNLLAQWYYIISICIGLVYFGLSYLFSCTVFKTCFAFSKWPWYDTTFWAISNFY